MYLLWIIRNLTKYLLFFFYIFPRINKSKQKKLFEKYKFSYVTILLLTKQTQKDKENHLKADGV